MLFEHIGHAEFLIELDCGMRIVTDPYDKSCGYPVRLIEADAALVSHQHHDHNAVDNVGGHPQIINYAGEHTLAPGVTVTAVLSDHDDANGAKRGKTLLFRIKAEGLRVTHLGDIGRLLTAEEAALIGETDVLMIPVGGYFTVNAMQAKQIAGQLNARVILPMHYKTAYNQDWPIADETEFTALFDEKDVRRGGEVLRVTRGDLECQPRVVIL